MLVMSEKTVLARPASSVLMIRQNDRLEVLMVQRPARGFFGGLMVFPGGAVEACDTGSGGPDIDGQFRIAGLRETAEEVGLAITSSGSRPSPRLRGAELLMAVDDWGLDRMTLVSRWLTPKFAPKRFDTRFYLVPIMGDPEIVLDTNELVDYSWIGAEEALDKYHRDEWSMILPTISHLRWLARRSSVSGAEAAARGADGMTIIEPIEKDRELLVRYRGDDAD
jgi:8-oxo-dGTP pyrophosphatase MutT (NUDIX family)